MKFTRTIRCVTITTENGERRTIPNITLGEAKKMLNNLGIEYSAIDEVDKLYSCSIEDFLSVATEVKRKTEN